MLKLAWTRLRIGEKKPAGEVSRRGSLGRARLARRYFSYLTPFFATVEPGPRPC